jgi:hypothetical protein
VTVTVTESLLSCAEARLIATPTVAPKKMRGATALPVAAVDDGK